MKNSDEPSSPATAGPQSGLAAEKSGGLPGSTGTAPVATSSSRTWALALAAGLAAGVIGWAIAEAALIPVSGVGLRVYDYTGKSAASAEAAPIPDSGLARRQGNGVNVSPATAAGLRNAVITYGTLGAALGLGLGLAGGLIHRSRFRSVLAGATGLVLGGITGVVMASLLAPVFYKNLSADDLTYSLIVHAGIWGAVGAVASLAFGLGLGGWGRMLRVTVGGAGAALLAAAIYEFAGGILVPGAMTNLPVSVTWQTRVAAQLLVTLLVAAGVVLAAGLGAEGQAPVSRTRHGDT